MRNLVIL